MRDYQIDTIIHFAAESHVDNSIAGPEIFFQTNVMGTFALLEEARLYWQVEKKWGEQQCRFHHVSTDEVYGSLMIDEPAFTESSCYLPNSPYAASKASSDHLVRSYFHTYKFPTTQSNCSNNFGPYQHREKLIPVVIGKCLQQAAIPIYGNGTNIRDWLYVDDHCIAIDLILQHGKPGECYNIGGDHEISNLDLTKHICQIMDKIRPVSKPYQQLITFVEDRKGHDWRYAINQQKIVEQLGFSPQKNIEDLLMSTIHFYIDAMSESGA